VSTDQIRHSLPEQILHGQRTHRRVPGLTRTIPRMGEVVDEPGDLKFEIVRGCFEKVGGSLQPVVEFGEVGQLDRRCIPEALKVLDQFSN
jgi:hypothetical protein